MVQIDVDGVREITTILFALLLLQRLSCNDFKCLLDIDALLGAGLEVGHLSTILTISVCSFLGDHPPVFTDIDLVAEDDKREAFRVTRAGLDKELVAPGIEVLERLCRVDVVHQYAAVGASVEGHAERLEAFLARSVPQLEGHNAIVDGDFFGEEIRADRGLV